MDNAIEANLNVPVQDRFISLNITQQQDYLSINVSNPVMELVNVLHNISTENLRDYQIPKTDTDGDGIYDYYEYSVGTDINNADTDDDSALDGDEIYEQMYTENTKEDTVINSLSVKTNCAGLLDEQITIEDVSGSMSYGGSMSMAKSTLNAFIDALYGKDEAQKKMMSIMH